jgi:hypothetical protein
MLGHYIHGKFTISNATSMSHSVFAISCLMAQEIMIFKKFKCYDFHHFLSMTRGEK